MIAAIAALFASRGLARALAFVAGPTGRALALVAAVIIAGGYVYHKGYVRASGACKADKALSQLAAARTDLAAAHAATAAAEAAAADARKLAAKHRTALDDLDRSTRAARGNCRATRDDLRRLRRIH